ncbi:MAG: riboflavin biosynthesis protein RibD [Kordiimonas sp.]|nr:riboflavin biosynthesis protein RibD [Kordiimonas sp.]
MKAALALAYRGLGRVWPNPAVGCVIVDRKGHVVSRGWTQPGGRPHAEQIALDAAGDKAAGATVYVTLEPCAHHGVTPPCAQALIDAHVGRVVVAIMDPDPRVAGRGLDMLKAAGITVELGIGADEARKLNAGFLTKVSQQRPYVILKAATSIDGLIATGTGQSKWITGPSARKMAHYFRGQVDAILVGSATVLADDPALTCRLEGMEDRSPVKIVLDTALKLSTDCQLLKTAGDVPVWIVTTQPETHPKAQAFISVGAEIVFLEKTSEDLQIDIGELLTALAARGITRLMVEGGSHVNASFLQQRVVDRLLWFRAPLIIGGDGLNAIQACGVKILDQAHRFSQVTYRPLEDGQLEIYERER